MFTIVGTNLWWCSCNCSEVEDGVAELLIQARPADVESSLAWFSQNPG